MTKKWTVRKMLCATGVAVALGVVTCSVYGATQIFGIYGDAGEGYKTDSQCTGWITFSDQLAVRDRMASWNPDFLISAGDNIYFKKNSVPPSYPYDYTMMDATESFDIAVGQYYGAYIRYPSGGASCFAPAEPSVNRYFPCAGNHDWDWDLDDSLTAYVGYFDLPGANISVGTVSSGKERYYDFIQGDVHFFVISSDPREPDGITAPAETDGTTTPSTTQAAWLKQAMAASTAPWKFVYFHHPAYSSGGNTAALQWPFQLWGADVVMYGHVHAYERVMHAVSTNPKIPFITSGLGGRPIQSFGTPLADSVARFNTEFGAIRAEVTAKTASLVFYTAGGRMVDSLYLAKNGAGGTVDSKVSASADDAEENTSGAVDIASSDLEMVDDTIDWGSDQMIGLRFQNITVPHYAIINKAYLQFSTKTSDSGTDNLTIRGQAADNPGSFVASTLQNPNHDISNRSGTTATASWSPNSWTLVSGRTSSGPDQLTPDLSSIVEEIVNRPGWASGNAMVMAVFGSAGVRRAWSYDGNAAEAPRLHIEWELPDVKLGTTSASDGWTFYPFLNGGGSQFYVTTTSSIDTTGLQNPAPQAIYQKMQKEGSSLTWTASHLSPSATYKVRVHLCSIQFTGYQNVSETLWVSNGGSPNFVSGVTPYGSGGFNKAKVVELGSMTPSSAGQLLGGVDVASGSWAVLCGVEILKNP